MALSRHESKAAGSDDAAPSGEVLALVRERGMYLNSSRPDRIIQVDDQLALRGWCVDAKGELHRVDPNRNKVADKAAEEPAEEKPVKRRRPRASDNAKENAAAEPAPEKTAE